MNRAERLSISDRTYLYHSFVILRHPELEDTGLGINLCAARHEWRFIGDSAIRKSDGYTVTYEEVRSTEIWA